MAGSGSMLLILLAQPCVGAFIGYLTNKIAIRMLFRPLQPWYVLGWRVPLTPGVIPAKRRALAVNIGEMVGLHLLTSEEIGRSISGEPFQEHLHNLVTRQLDAFCQKKLPALGDLFPVENNPVLLTLQVSLIRELQESFNRYLASPLAAEQLAAWLQAAGKKSADEQADRTVLRQLVEKILEKMLANGGQHVGTVLATMLQQAGSEGKQLRDLIPKTLAQHLHALVEAQAPGILERIAQQLLAPEARPALLHALITAVHQLLESLGPMGAMARGFFETDTFSRKINEYLNKNSGAIKGWLNSPEMQRRLSGVLGESVDTLLDRDVAEVLAGFAPGQVDALCIAIGGHFVAALDNGAVREELGRTFTGTLHHFLQGAPGNQGIDSASSVLTLLRSDQGTSFVDAAVESFVQWIFSLPLGVLVKGIPQEFRELVVARITKHANLLFLYELSGLVQALNIKELVSDKVDSLDLLRLERLILGIMEEQFKYINLFGALLGFLIGLTNLLLFQLL